MLKRKNIQSLRLGGKVKRHHFFHLVHLIAVFILGSYFVLSKVNLVHALLYKSVLESFLQIYLFGVFFACLFLYIFSHEKFFPVAKEIEKEEEKTEKTFLKKYLHHGKILATFLIGMVGGPVFSSLTARILLNKFDYKYLLVILANIPSSILTVGISRGFIQFFNL